MPRYPRVTPAGYVYHVLNRGNDRKLLFHKTSDYQGFLEHLREALTRFAVRLIAYCLMPNHWHLLLWPEGDNAIPAYLHRVTTLHALQVRELTGTVGHGHVYQGRYKSFPVQTEVYYWNVLRYVEANALRANLVPRAEAWQWSSAGEYVRTPSGILVPGPLPVPPNWLDIVNAIPPKYEIDEIRESIRRGRPYGSNEWTRATAMELGLQHTLRSRGGQWKRETARGDISQMVAS
jgi:putative transposase